MTATVSVLMPVYNAADYVKEAIESILAQDYTHFELIIIDDGSTDNTAQIVGHYKKSDPRITFLHHSKNRGLVTILNEGLNIANGDYIARMDADDISLPNRLSRQVAFMEENPEIGVSSAWLKTFGKKNGIVWKNPTDDREIRAKSFCSNPIWHPLAIMRKSVVGAHHLRYHESYVRQEDYKMWIDFMKVSQLANIPEILLHYRLHDQQATKQIPKKLKIRLELAEELAGRPLTQIETEQHQLLFTENPKCSWQQLETLETWIDQIKEINRHRSLYDEPFFSDYLDRAYGNFLRRRFYTRLKKRKRYHPGIFLDLLLNEKKPLSMFKPAEFLKIFVKSALFWPVHKSTSHE